MTLQRWALGVEYHGGGYHGWQRQNGLPTIQAELEAALSAVAGTPLSVIAAGRTDRGVHATGQVVHFDTPVSRPAQAWVRGTNAHLSTALAVRWAIPVTEPFHARFSAHSRSYGYRLVSHAIRPALEAGRVGWTHRPLHLDLLREGCQLLLGTHDFSSFRAAECQAKSPIKTLHRAEVTQIDDEFRFLFQADAFVHHMVRNLMGALVRVGSGDVNPGWIAELLQLRDRTRAAPTFSPDGLCLIGVGYDPRWNLPTGQCMT